jgi:hypothetical protein
MKQRLGELQSEAGPRPKSKILSKKITKAKKSWVHVSSGTVPDWLSMNPGFKPWYWKKQ